MKNLNDALALTRADFEEDQKQIAVLSARLKRIATGSCTPQDLPRLKGLHRNFRAMIEFRRAAMTRLATRVEKVAKAARTVLESPVLQEAAALGGAVTVLSLLLDLEGLEKDVASVIKAWRDRLTAAREAFEARATADARQFGGTLAAVAGGLSDLLDQLHGNADGRG